MPYIKIKKSAKDKIRKRKYSNHLPREIKYVDYKNIDLITKFLTPQGKIMAARQSGLTANQQRALTLAVKRARYMALIPYTIERVRKEGSFREREQREPREQRSEAPRNNTPEAA